MIFANLLAWNALSKSWSFNWLNWSRLSCSWQNTFTTFCPVMVSSIQPFTAPMAFCCARKYRLLKEPIFFVATSIMPTISSVTSVSGISRTSIHTRTLTMVMALLIIWGMLWLIIWRRVSMSLV